MSRKIKGSLNFATSNTPSDNNTMFVDNTDNKLKFKDNAGTIIDIGNNSNFLNSFLLNYSDKIRRNIKNKVTFNNLFIDVLDDNSIINIGNTTSTKFYEDNPNWAYDTFETTMAKPDRTRWRYSTSPGQIRQENGYVEIYSSSAGQQSDYFWSAPGGSYGTGVNGGPGNGLQLMEGDVILFEMEQDSSINSGFTLGVCDYYRSEVINTGSSDNNSYSKRLWRYRRTIDTYYVEYSTDGGLTWTTYDTQTMADNNVRIGVHLYFYRGWNAVDGNYTRIYWILNANQIPKFYWTNGNFETNTLVTTSSNIKDAILVADTDETTGITYQLSANGGINWETVLPNERHSFTNTGTDLRAKITIPNGDKLYSYLINYEV